ncbi:UDP-glucose 6-dehydrogenase [Devosia limi DSM 17137]|uniref:UDP-glucose 6-dehydrogenase n=1 Tax=Devosia limi DSM 17137 TaxID=1121477 RepID=A0A0F5LP50_9HYPH|nr:UDP-glucose/GDP-mannose dehydrogenase family protein [Devosia limi]KKB84068.1 UDP-glucose 6-dehydrogenase [Devosia limi DSM 17137]SHE63673.1 UDP-glucose dehydrogenase [Devosia limi DSM 17137]
MKIAIVGAGYVGLVTGACLADFGHEITCVDSDASRVAALQRGEIPIYEPGLKELVASNEAAGRLVFSGDLAVAADAEVVFLAVGTPSRRGDGHADLTHVHAAARALAQHLSGFTVVAIKSTVPVGTGDAVAAIIAEANPAADFVVVSNPEFLREGAAIEDFKRPDRVVVGLEDERGRAPMAEVYRPLYLNQAPILFTGRRSAELTKYASNAFLAMKVTFINEMADLCEAAGGNVQDVARGLGLDKRIGSKFLNAGPGYGGSCFPKDTQALVRIGEEFGAPMRLVETTVAINEARRGAMADKIIAACDGSVAGKTIAMLGLTFKPNTDDMREAPSIAIIGALQAAGAEIVAHDPEGMAAAQGLLPDVAMAAGPYEAAAGADALVLMTEWNAFRSLDLARLKASMRGDVIVDLRNIYRHEEMERHGFRYDSVGRPVAGMVGAE